jgi:hypothetical protein
MDQRDSIWQRHLQFYIKEELKAHIQAGQEAIYTA